MNEESLNQIFSTRFFKIPDYQRGYAWTEKQFTDFWEDVVGLPLNRNHYTGLLSLKKVDERIWTNWNEERWLIEKRGLEPFHVVDGQQRLMTLVIFIQAITELIRMIPENKEKKDEDIYLGSFSLKEIKEKYILVQKPPQFIITSYKFSYEVANHSSQFLKYRIFNEPDSGTVQESLYTLNLENSKKFFIENLSEYYKKYGITEIETLFTKLTQNLKFNIYEISGDFDVFVAFETINNRGKKLSNLELLKNRLIYLTTLYDDSELKVDVRDSLRGKINDAWKEVYYQLGRSKLFRLPDNDFLIAHWIMFFQYTRKKGDDYKTFLLEKKFTPQNVYDKIKVKINSLREFEDVRGDFEIETEEMDMNSADEAIIERSKLMPEDIKEYVSSLKSAAVHWYNTYNPINNADLTNEESLWLDRLNRIGIGYFRPLVTASFLSKDISTDDRIKLFKAIERFIFITFRLSRAYSTYRNSEFYNAARELIEGNLSVYDIINKLELNMAYCFYTNEESEKGESFFDYTYFQKFIEKKFKSESSHGFYDWNGLRYFLYEYEMDKVRKRGSQKIDWKLFIKGEKDKVSIEHIFPQTPDKKCWKKAFKGIDNNKLKYMSGTLGNLLPLSQSINSSLQNDCFKDKIKAKYNDKGKKIRQGYDDGSHSEIEVSKYGDWDANAILDRGIILLNFMEDRWNVKFENKEAKTKLLFLDFMLYEH